MAIRYVFIDESGQFGKYKDEKYFVIASFSTSNPIETAKKFKAWMSTRFPRKMRLKNEIKWSNSGINNLLRLRTLEYIAGLDIEIRFTCVLKKDIPIVYYSKKGLESGQLYVDIIKQFVSSHDYLGSLSIICDKRPLKRNIFHRI